jgi:hypothetical protein
VVGELQRLGWSESDADTADVVIVIEPSRRAGEPRWSRGEMDGRPFLALATDPLEPRAAGGGSTFGTLPKGWARELESFLRPYPEQRVLVDPKLWLLDSPAASTPSQSPSAGGHVFISYSRSDQDYVDRLFAHLERAGLNPWIDRSGIDYGTRWKHVVRDAVDGCSAFVVVMTPDAEDSEWVDRELQRAQDDGKPILPLLLRGRKFFSLGDVHYEDVIGGRLPSDEFVARLRTHRATRR